MCNYILLCHGGLNQDRSFHLEDRQTVIYRGNFGSLLSGAAARRLVATLTSDPTVTDAQLRIEIPNYVSSEEAEGPGDFRPDINLSGDDKLMCFVMDMSTGRWLKLNSAWRSRLSALVEDLGEEFTLNLLCCTLLPESGVDAPHPDPNLQVPNWDMLRKVN
ncbi:hypothetical protein [uncultured Gimesia sp.]|uniref:hypothetical protein n=1 Tax=uncultured Gimesia sp. TaxID=1678688 RepID=UPI0030D9F1C4